MEQREQPEIYQEYAANSLPRFKKLIEITCSSSRQPQLEATSSHDDVFWNLIGPEGKTDLLSALRMLQVAGDSLHNLQPLFQSAFARLRIFARKLGGHVSAENPAVGPLICSFPHDPSAGPLTETFPANAETGTLLLVITFHRNSQNPGKQYWPINVVGTDFSWNRSVYVAVDRKWVMLCWPSAESMKLVPDDNLSVAADEQLVKVLKGWNSYAANVTPILQWLLLTCTETRHNGSSFNLSPAVEKNVSHFKLLVRKCAAMVHQSKYFLSLEITLYMENVTDVPRVTVRLRQLQIKSSKQQLPTRIPGLMFFTLHIDAFRSATAAQDLLLALRELRALEDLHVLRHVVQQMMPNSAIPCLHHLSQKKCHKVKAEALQVLRLRVQEKLPKTQKRKPEKETRNEPEQMPAALPLKSVSANEPLRVEPAEQGLPWKHMLSPEHSSGCIKWDEFVNSLEPFLESAGGTMIWKAGLKVQICFSRKPADQLPALLESVVLSPNKPKLECYHTCITRVFKTMDLDVVDHPVSTTNVYFSMVACRKQLFQSVRAINFISELMRAVSDVNIGWEVPPKVVAVCQTPVLLNVIYTFIPGDSKGVSVKILVKIHLKPVLAGSANSANIIQFTILQPNNPIAVYDATFGKVATDRDCDVIQIKAILERVLRGAQQQALHLHIVQKSRSRKNNSDGELNPTLDSYANHKMLPLVQTWNVVQPGVLLSLISKKMADLRKFITQWQPHGTIRMKQDSFCCWMYFTKSLDFSDLQIQDERVESVSLSAVSSSYAAGVAYAVLKLERKPDLVLEKKMFSAVIRVVWKTSGVVQMARRVKTHWRTETAECSAINSLNMLLNDWASSILLRNKFPLHTSVLPQLKRKDSALGMIFEQQPPLKKKATERWEETEVKEELSDIQAVKDFQTDGLAVSLMGLPADQMIVAEEAVESSCLESKLKVEKIYYQ